MRCPVLAGLVYTLVERAANGSHGKGSSGRLRREEAQGRDLQNQAGVLEPLVGAPGSFGRRGPWHVQPRGRNICEIEAVAKRTPAGKSPNTGEKLEPLLGLVVVGPGMALVSVRL